MSLNILNLVLYSDDIHYTQMYEITRKYYSTFPYVNTIYYKFSSEITDDYLLQGDILLIKGTETLVPGVLDKTIKAFKFCLDYCSFLWLVE